MSYLYNVLTTEQKCAVLGFAIDFCGCNKNPSPKQFADVEDLLANICQELDVPKDKVESFVNKMQVNGRLEYAIKVLKTIENKRFYGLFYPYFYSVVATLNSPEGLSKLDKIYNNEFGYDDEEIKNIWELSEIKDFRKSTTINITNNHYESSSSLGEIATVLRGVKGNFLDSVVDNVPSQEMPEVVKSIYCSINKLKADGKSIVAVKNTIKQIKPLVKNVYESKDPATLNCKSLLSERISIIFLNVIEKAIIDTIDNESIDQKTKQSFLRVQLEQARDVINWLNTLVYPSNFEKWYSGKISEFKNLGELYGLNPKYWDDKGACYIATMAYGNYEHPQVIVLRQFRDSYLSKYEWGQKFIRFYYAHSPRWVELLRNHTHVNVLIRIVLDSFVCLWKKTSNYKRAKRNILC